MNFRRPRTEAPEINLIPFIDVLLVVLIFLMLTTTYTRVAQMNIELPTSDSSPSPKPALIDLSISRDGRYMVGSTPVASRASLPEALRTAAKGQPGSTVSIVADALATHQSVIDALRAASEAGLPNVAFATQNTAPGARAAR